MTAAVLLVEVGTACPNMVQTQVLVADFKIMAITLQIEPLTWVQIWNFS